MPRVFLSEEQKESIISATYQIIKQRIQKDFPCDPSSIYTNYTEMNEQQKNGFWNEVQLHTGIEHSQAYKYFVNSWTRQAFQFSVKDNRYDFINYIVAYYMKHWNDSNVCSVVWTELKKIVLRNKWHLSQSYAMSHHNLVRLIRTNAEVNILNFLLYEEHSRQLQTILDPRISRRVRLHLKELVSRKDDILEKYRDINQEDEINMITILRDLAVSNQSDVSSNSSVAFDFKEFISILNKYE